MISRDRIFAEDKNNHIEARTIPMTVDSAADYKRSLYQKLLWGLKDPKLFSDSVKGRFNRLRDERYIAHLKRHSISKNEFLKDIRLAVENNTGFASGKIGVSQQYWMYYEVFLSKAQTPERIKNYEDDLIFHGLKQHGIFPPDPRFYLEYNEFYMNHVRNLDSLGICYRRPEREIIEYYKLKNKCIHYAEQEPDRSVPSDESKCYLNYFRNKRVLIICPFAGLLKERATKEVFEGVWSKTGKKWFYPAEVTSLEFSYGFSAETQRRYGTALDLFQDITSEISRREFDVALIGAAGLAIPIASHIKNMGRIGIDLGGHLQILFGVLGKRWRDMHDFVNDYVTDFWIDMPEKYRPKETDTCDSGAYW